MKRSLPTLFLLILMIGTSSNAFAGHIAGGRTAGNITGGRAAGNITGGRASGNIPGGRSATVASPSVINSQLTTESSQVDFETAMSGTFAGLIRMLLESGALF
jgi:hypothetical protein